MKKELKELKLGKEKEEKKNEKGRAMGKMVIEIRRELAEVEKEHGLRES